MKRTWEVPSCIPGCLYATCKSGSTEACICLTDVGISGAALQAILFSSTRHPNQAERDLDSYQTNTLYGRGKDLVQRRDSRVEDRFAGAQVQYASDLSTNRDYSKRIPSEDSSSLDAWKNYKTARRRVDELGSWQLDRIVANVDMSPACHLAEYRHERRYSRLVTTDFVDDYRLSS
ncbi:hypothetical protein KJ359_009547 [Pestalotiopsis sp. 9143b]|nr:hypothetical protein KJ359_009547 [Pestalotiopsis sp. 9143b]